MSDSLPGRSALGGAGKALTRREWLVRQRERDALDMWISGKSYAQIKNAHGLKNQDAARELVSAGAARWETEEGEQLARYRAAQVSDMMELRAMMMEAVRGGDQYAADRAMKAWERLSRLMGLDAQKEREPERGGNVFITDPETAARLAGIDLGDVVEGEWTPAEKEPRPGLPGSPSG